MELPSSLPFRPNAPYPWSMSVKEKEFAGVLFEAHPEVSDHTWAIRSDSAFKFDGLMLVFYTRGPGRGEDRGNCRSRPPSFTRSM